MRSWARGWLAAGAAFALTGCVLPLDIEIHDGTHIRGSGHVVTMARALPAFDGVVAGGALTVLVERTGAEVAHVTAEDNILPYLETEVRGGILYIGFRQGVSVSPRRDIVVRVEAFEVVELEASGAVFMEADLGFVPELWVSLSGASHLRARGAADWQSIAASGASRYDGLDVETFESVVDASGASEVLVWARDRLDAEASGASHVRFLGNPAVYAHVSGASTVSPY